MNINRPNPAQLELLHAMASIETEEELHELKLALSQFFARRAQKEIHPQQKGQISNLPC